jgi:AcrR family transcriptional regulator
MASASSEQRLIEAGKAVLFEEGFSGLTLRKVAARAKVNLGMFNYLFKDKDDFIRKVAQEAYDEFYGSLQLGALSQKDPMLALREAALVLARFVRDHRQAIGSLMRDLNAGHPEALRFARKNIPRHGIFLSTLVKRCRSQKRIKDLPLATLMTFMAGAVLAPNQAFGLVERMSQGMPMLKALLPVVRRDVLSDKAIEARLDLAFAAILKERKR